MPGATNQKTRSTSVRGGDERCRCKGVTGAVQCKHHPKLELPRHPTSQSHHAPEPRLFLAFTFADLLFPISYIREQESPSPLPAHAGSLPRSHCIIFPSSTPHPPNMDVAYNQHSTAARRKNRSSTSLHHLTLAPLTTKLPIDDDDLANIPLTTPSYIQGKSAPTTPRLLSRSPARSSNHTRRSGTTTPSEARLPKSKSTTHLPHHNRAARTQPGSPTLKRRPGQDQFSQDRAGSDWLLRAGALISTETRESKGQAWLVSRASSTSVGGMMRDADEDAFERQLREQLAASGSRRHSGAGASEDGDHMSSPPYSRYGSRAQSRVGSRSASRVGSRSRLITPLEMRSTTTDGYFPAMERDEVIPGPDFVNLDEPLEAGDEVDTSLEDEAHVRRLVKKGSGGVGTWFDSVLGLQLFSVEEDSEESDEEDEGTTEGEGDESHPRRSASTLRLEGLKAAPKEPVPPPNPEQGGWHDAAWLLTVASKVIL